MMQCLRRTEDWGSFCKRQHNDFTIDKEPRVVTCETVLAELAREGLLLESDSCLPSVTSLVAGAPVRGSWWGHRRGRAIYAVLQALADDGEVLFTKLVGGKVTLVHRRLWPALVGVALARAPWQLRGLTEPARRLLARVEREE